MIGSLRAKGTIVSAWVSVWLVRRRRFAAAIGLLLLAVGAVSATQVEVSTGYRAFMNQSDRDLETADWFAARSLGDGDVLSLVFVPSGGDLFDASALASYSQIAASARDLPHVTRADSLFDADMLVRIEGASEPRALEAHRSISILPPGDFLADDARAALAAAARANPAVAGRHVARDGGAGLVTLVAALDDDPATRRAQIDEIEAALDQVRSDVATFDPDARVMLVGSTLFDRAVVEVLRSDARILFPLAAAAFFGFLFLTFRTLSHAGMVLFVIAGSAIGAFGAGAAAGMSITILSFSGLLLIATLAVADSVHIIGTFATIDAAGDDPTAALVESLKINFWPIVATTATDMIGYSALLFSASPAVRDMGLLVIFGVAFALLLTFLILPALILATGRPKPTGLASTTGWVFEAIGRFAARRARLVLMLVFACAAIAATGLQRIELRDSVDGWFAPGVEFREGLDLMADQFRSLQSFTVGVSVEPDDLGAAAAFPTSTIELERHRLLDRSLSEIDHVVRWTTPATAAAAFERAAAQPASPLMRSADEIAALGDAAAPVSMSSLASAGLASAPEPGLRGYTFWNADAAGASNGELVAAADRALEAAVAAMPGHDVKSGGLGVAFARLGEENLHGILIGSVSSLAVMTLCLVAAFGSVKLGLLSLIPNLLPLLMIYGAFGHFGADMNLATLTVFSVALGIIVDDNIHVFMKYQAKRAAGLDPDAAVRETVRLGGPAMTISSLTLATGFFILSASQFTLTAQKAFLVGATILLAMVLDLVATPALLKLADSRRSRQTAPPFPVDFRPT